MYIKASKDFYTYQFTEFHWIFILHRNSSATIRFYNEKATGIPVVWVSVLKDTQTDLSFTTFLPHLIEKMWQVLELITLSFWVKTIFANTGFLLSVRASDTKTVSDMILITPKFKTYSVPHSSTIMNDYKKKLTCKVLQFLKYTTQTKIMFLHFLFTIQHRAPA